MKVEERWDSELKFGMPILVQHVDSYEVTIEPRVNIIFIALWKNKQHMISSRLHRDSDSDKIFGTAEKLVQKAKELQSAGTDDSPKRNTFTSPLYSIGGKNTCLK